jgi:curved DNA-binding protein CbpA
MAVNADEEIKRIKGESNYYALLNVSKGCSEAELKKAFRKFALLLHPDKCQAIGAEEAFKKISSAYQCLSNASSRQTYDVSGRDDDSGGGGGGGFPRGPGGVDLDELLKQFMREAQENGGGGMGGGGTPFMFHFGGPGGFQGSHNMFQNRGGGDRQRGGGGGGGANYVIIGLVLLGIYLAYSFFALLLRNFNRVALVAAAVLISSRLTFLSANQRSFVRNGLFVFIFLCPNELISYSSTKT